MQMKNFVLYTVENVFFLNRVKVFRTFEPDGAAILYQEANCTWAKVELMRQRWRRESVQPVIMHNERRRVEFLLVFREQGQRERLSHAPGQRPGTPR